MRSVHLGCRVSGMRGLTEREEMAFRDAVTSGTYDSAMFNRAVRIIEFHTRRALPGVNVFTTDDWPTRVYDWRRRREWALDLLDRHQAASMAANVEYWRVFMPSNKQ